MADVERCGCCFVHPLVPNGLCRRCDGRVPCARPGCGKPFERHRIEAGARFPFRPYGASADICESFVIPDRYVPRGREKETPHG